MQQKKGRKGQVKETRSIEKETHPWYAVYSREKRYQRCGTGQEEKALGVKENITVKYMSQKHIFADMLNYFIYGGRQVIGPDSLEELDIREAEALYGGKDGDGQPAQMAGDVMGSLAAMTDGRAAYLLLAVEAQPDIYDVMLAENMLYDAFRYAEPVSGAAVSHRCPGGCRGADGDGYLPGFRRQGRILPVVTLVVYFSAREWDGPMSLHEMFGEQDVRVLALVPDYKINLVAPVSIKDDDFKKFRTSLKEVMAFIKYSQDADRLGEVVEAGEGFRHLGRAEVDVLNACVGAKIEMEKDKEETNVCLAIEEMKRKAAEKAAAEAAKETAEKERIAAEKDRMSTLLKNIKNLMEKAGWSAEHSMDVLDVSEGDRKKIQPLIR